MMRKEQWHASRKISLLFVFLSTIFIFSTPSIADEITIVADQWSPYCGVPDTAKPGYGIEIAQLAFKNAGHTVKYINMPWNRAITATRKGNYNAIIGAYKEEAPDFVFPEEEFGVTNNCFYVKNGNSWKFKDLQSLQNLRVGLVEDYSYGEELDRYFKEHKESVQYARGEDPSETNIRKLLAGRFDVFIEDENVVLEKIEKMGVADKVINAGETGVKGKIYIAFSPNFAKSKEYADIFTKGIKTLEESGELKKILDKYGLKHWK